MAAVEVPTESLEAKMIRLKAVNEKMAELNARYYQFKEVRDTLRAEIEDIEQQMVQTLF